MRVPPIVQQVRSLLSKPQSAGTAFVLRKSSTVLVAFDGDNTVGRMIAVGCLLAQHGDKANSRMAVFEESVQDRHSDGNSWRAARSPVEGFIMTTVPDFFQDESEEALRC